MEYADYLVLTSKNCPEGYPEPNATPEEKEHVQRKVLEQLCCDAVNVGKWSSQYLVHVLGSVMRVPLQSIYPEFFRAFKFLDRLIPPREPLDNPSPPRAYIQWTLCEAPVQSAREPNHFCPCLSR